MTDRISDVELAKTEEGTFLEALVREKRILVCCGAGGVGKTTTAAALGLAAASLGRRVLVLTIDPARRLSEAMGVPAGADAPVAVTRDRLDALDVPLAGELHAWMLSPAVVLERMVKRLASSEERAKAILESRLYAQLARVVAGMQEYTAAEALHDASTSGLYDLVVLDTPPSRNALEFLEAPRKLSMFLDERVVGVFLPGRRNPFVRAAAELVETVFSRVFGASFFAELQGFLGSFGGGLGGMREHSEAVRSLLLSDATSFVLVTSPEPAALAEARFFQKKILELGLPFGGFVLNRSWAYTRGYGSPESLALGDDASMSAILALRKLVQLADGERWRAERDRNLLARLRMDAGSGEAVATPHLGGAVEDLAGLAALARNLIRLDAG